MIGLDYREAIKKGDKVTVSALGMVKTGTVIYVDWYKEDGYLMDFAEGWNYRQSYDGGKVTSINGVTVSL